MTGYLNNNISALSSSGFDSGRATISLVAPGELNWALCSTDAAMYADCTDLAGQPSPVEESGGTSESAPLTAGVGGAGDPGLRQDPRRSGARARRW